MEKHPVARNVFKSTLYGSSADQVRLVTNTVQQVQELM